MALKYLASAVFLICLAGSPGQLGWLVYADTDNGFTTQTVYGFLDFTTTIGNTIMVFSPQSAPPDGGQKGKETSSISVIQTKPADTQKRSSADIQPSKTHKSDTQGDTKKHQIKGTKIVVTSVTKQNIVTAADKAKVRPTTNENVITSSETVKSTPTLSSVVHVQSKSDTPGVKNNLAEPEYDFLSKQPSEVVDETYKLINLRPASKAHAKPRASVRREKENPTGLVTKLGGTNVKDGLTTVHETSVIGTYINGKYAQILQSSSRVLPNAVSNPEERIRPSNTLRILKTIGSYEAKQKPHLEPTPTNHQEESSLPLEALFNPSPGNNVRTTRRHSGGGSGRGKFRNRAPDDYENSNDAQQPRTTGKNRPNGGRSNYKNRVPTTTTTSEPPTARRRSGFRPSTSPVPPLKQLIKQKNEQQLTPVSPVPKVKLPRAQGRWSYKTTPKPRIAIRKQADDEELRPLPDVGTIEPSSSPHEEIKTTSVNVSTNMQKKLQEAFINDEELDPSGSEDVASVTVHSQQAETILPIETVNVEISTAADISDAYFEIATIKSPYVFQVGTLRNTRYITVTSTLKKSFATAEPSPSPTASEPLTENILANTGAAYETTLPLDSSIATLPAISLDATQTTPPLETLTETFSTTQTFLKTHLLPFIHGGNTTRLTLVQTYNIARIVTATKTLPPMEIYQFIPSKTLNEFNSKLDEAGSELHLELDYSDDDKDDEDIPRMIVAPVNDADSDMDILRPASPKVKQEPPPLNTTVDNRLSPVAQQLALLKYLGQAQPQVITTSRPVVVLETIYESHVIPVVNSGNTIYSTLSRPVATVPRTSYEYGLSTIPPLPVPQVPQVPQVPLFPQQPQFTITSAPIVTQTVTTISESRVLKLTFGAKTAFTTLFSTKVVPTELTTYMTTTVPLQPTIAAYPGYYPPPVGYPPFPFVG